MGECEVCGEKIAKGKRFCEVCAPSESNEETIFKVADGIGEVSDQTAKVKKASGKIENLGDANSEVQDKDSEDGVSGSQAIDDPLNSDFNLPEQEENL